MAEADTAPPERKRKDLATRDTPLIRNQWYVAARSEEVTRKPIRRTVLEQDVVLYRTEDGKLVGLQNRCAHRSYPLHLGELNGDRIVCGYHGFEFGPDGRCAHVPALDAARPGIRIQSYPLVEVGPFIWIWTGDPDAVDYGKLVEQPWFAESDWRYVSGYVFIRANYLALHENLHDLTHLPFLHVFAKGLVEIARHEHAVEVRPDGVYATIKMNAPVPPALQNVMNFSSPFVNDEGGTTFQTPAMEVGFGTLSDPADPSKRMTRYFVHCLTPESATATHYFWAVSRNVGLTDPELDEEYRQIAQVAFEEDARALEEMEDLIRRENRPGFREAIIRSDAGGVHVLRQIARMAEAESAAESA